VTIAPYYIGSFGHGIIIKKTMAINVDTVYQRVLAILNKEQRGFLSPEKFNLHANHVQLDIFEQYFYDLQQFLEMPGNSSEYSDMVSILEHKISLFETEESTPTFSNPYFTLPSDLHRLGSVIYGTIECTELTKKQYIYVAQSPIGKPSDALPIFIKDANGIKVYGAAIFTDIAPSANPISLQYVKKPSNVVWGYTSVFGEAQYNANTSTHFELDPGEETDLVIKILALAGLEIKDITVYEAASREDLTESQQEL